MNFGIGEDQVIQGFGIQAGIVIVSLALALIFTVRLLLRAYTDKDKIQEQRILDAKEFGNKIVEPLESLRIMTERQADLTEKMYGILQDGKRGN